MSKPLVDAAAVEHFKKNGWCVPILQRNALTAPRFLTDCLTDKVAELQAWTDEIAAWPLGRASRIICAAVITLAEGEYLHYREATDEGPKLCRTENFTPFHAGSDC